MNELVFIHASIDERRNRHWPIGTRPLLLRYLRIERLPTMYNHMVAYPVTPETIDRVFRALADATRRDIVARVLAEEQSVTALAARYDMSFAAVQKHVAVLEGAGLVIKRPQGRERFVRGNPESIARARELLSRLEGLWKDRFGQLDAVLTDVNARE